MPVRRLFLVLAAASSAAALSAAPAAAADTCDKVVAPGGSDAGAGTAAAPYATPQKVIRQLAPGQTGCVRGAVSGDVWIETSRITLTSEPGQRGTIRGEVVIDEETEGVTVRDLDLRKGDFEYPSPVILGDGATLSGNDITSDGRGICLLLGAQGHHSGANAERATVAGNRIHDCGTSNNHQHGIYVEHATDTKIIGNEIYDNADRGIQLYPNAQRTEIAGNVIDGNGQGIIISGAGGTSTNGTRVHHNVITNPRLRASIESWFDSDSPVGTDNVVERNCIFGGRRTIDQGGGGFVARENLFVDPAYVDRAAKDFRLAPGSPCADVLAAGRGQAAGVLPVDPEPVAPAAAIVSTTQSGAADAPLRIGLRSGPVTARSRTVTVRLRPLEPVGLQTYARVELRYRGRDWRFVGVKRVVRGYASAIRVRVPRRARGLAVRATLLQGDGREVVTFSARPRGASGARRRRGTPPRRPPAPLARAALRAPGHPLGQQPVARHREPERDLRRERAARLHARLGVGAPAVRGRGEHGLAGEERHRTQLGDVEVVVEGAGEVGDRVREEVVARPPAGVPAVQVVAEGRDHRLPRRARRRRRRARRDVAEAPTTRTARR
jgi:parallel beta-helix repeat protein